MSGGKARESACQYHLHFLIYNDLLRLIEFKVAEGSSALACITASLRSKWSHLVRIFLNYHIVALRPTLKMNLDHLLIDILFHDLSHTPVVNSILRINEAAYGKLLSRRKQSPVACQLQIDVRGFSIDNLLLSLICSL